MKKRFEPIVDKCGEIVDYLMSAPYIPDDVSLQFKIRLSVEEAVENVVRYAYDGGIGWLEVGSELEDDGVVLSIELRDAGVAFNPQGFSKPLRVQGCFVSDKEVTEVVDFLVKNNSGYSTENIEVSKITEYSKSDASDSSDGGKDSENLLQSHYL